MVHGILQPVKETEANIELSDSIEEGIITLKLHAVADTSVMHNKIVVF